MSVTGKISIPGLGEIRSYIVERRPLFQAKLNHGFWENWIAVERALAEEAVQPGAELDRLIRRRYFTEGGFLDEMAQLLDQWEAPPEGAYLSCGSQAFPEDEFLAPVPNTPRKEIDTFIRDKAPAFSRGVDGLMWKRAVLDGAISDFLQELHAFRVILVGPGHLRAHGRCWGWDDFVMIETHLTEARAARESILDKVVEAVSGAEYPIVLLQCGSLSAWLVARLYVYRLQAAVLDLGRALDFVDPDIILSQPWGAAHAEALASVLAGRVSAWTEWIDRHQAVPPRHHSAPVEASAPVPFVERKSLDHDQLEAALGSSAQSGHWANRGPAVDSLEASISRRLELAEHIAPVAVSSGTAAVWTAAAVAEVRHGAAIRWVTCSFGFFSSAIGPLADVQLLDCNERGMLSLDALRALDPDSYDGLIITDLFGRGDVRPYIEFAEQHGKQLIIDAAAGFDRDVYQELRVPVAFSFNHTKPFGFGEGGCLLVDAGEVDIARAVANFGHELPRHVASYCGNWKLSDLQAAAIHQRHATSPYWAPRYRLQYARIRQIAQQLDLKVFPAAGRMLNGKELATPSYLALLLERPVSQRALDQADLPFVARKYYRPLSPTTTASNLYSRIVCIPVHKDMAALDRDRIAVSLALIVALQEEQS